MATEKTIEDIVTAVSDAIKASTDISDWCVTNFGLKPLLMVNANMLNTPSEDDCPFIIIEKDYHDTGFTARYNEYSLYITFGVTYDAQQPFEIDETENEVRATYTMKGAELNAKFGYVIHNAIFSAISAFGNVNSEQITFDDTSMQPLYIGQMQFILQSERTMGCSSGSFTIS